MNKIVVLKGNKKILTFKVKTPKNSKQGETDIFIDSGKGLYFDKIVAGNYFKEFSQPAYTINSISWHGYFLPINKKKLSSPVIHLKNYTDKVAKLPHLGTINAEEPFPFLVFSLWVPEEMNLKDIGETKKNHSKSIYTEIKTSENKRLDFFVCPKSISANKFLETQSGLVYLFSNVEIFNTGTFEMVDPKNFNFQIIENVSGHDIIIRHSKIASKIFYKLKNFYSLIFHDPNDVYNRLFNRPVVTIDKNDDKNIALLRDETEKELGVEIENRGNIFEQIRNKFKK
ncbi:hypothetical protein DER71_12323 [Halanaerobium sp. DL-01]|uniref:hypothetical protein n=1 Tax=Halanaerobium sp. DL-01 TaxID=1653064 RepID=UPI000DF17E0F|nr:hypothetical protein [Halanaerobium sp. DL-01]RCW81658.1 hypothetical protein DER71_12323 [Halanaerobium sp. DL-01]